MTQIVVTPEQLDQTGTDFINKREELDALIQKANQLVSTLRGGAWKGNRANKFYSDWDSMYQQLKQAEPLLDQASTLLKNAGRDFSSADMA